MLGRGGRSLRGCRGFLGNRRRLLSWLFGGRRAGRFWDRACRGRRKGRGGEEGGEEGAARKFLGTSDGLSLPLILEVEGQRGKKFVGWEGRGEKGGRLCGNTTALEPAALPINANENFLLVGKEASLRASLRGSCGEVAAKGGRRKFSAR